MDDGVRAPMGLNRSSDGYDCDSNEASVVGFFGGVCGYVLKPMLVC